MSEVAYKHPAMCEVITKETEKLLFRNNITEHAQHFALCFLSQIAPRGNEEVCTRLVQICFSFFKVVVQKGAVNTKTMQAILRCLKRAIVDVKTEKADSGKSELLTKDIQDTMYRLVHLADIHIALQTLGLLLQIMTVRTGKYDRFYNAFYVKMLDPSLINVGPKAAAQYLHIYHRAVHMDSNVPRALAFNKRLLQTAKYFPPQITIGCLIVYCKLLKSRPELRQTTIDLKREDEIPVLAVTEAVAEESDDEEHYKDVVEETEEAKDVITEEDENETKPAGSWHHAKQAVNTEKKVSQIAPTKYNPYHRVPEYAGAEFILATELLRLVDHYHPTVQVFANNVIQGLNINYHGDPLRDFCLTQFLERFSFRNPKKAEENKSESLVQSAHNRKYSAIGGRGMSVRNLTRSNCTEDEKFIFDYLEKKREKLAIIEGPNAKKNKDDDDIDGDTASIGSVDDDEFESYLDSLGGATQEDEDDLDFLNELGNELKEDESKAKGKKQKKKSAADVDDDDDDEGDWAFDDDDADDG